MVSYRAIKKRLAQVFAFDASPGIDDGAMSYGAIDHLSPVHLRIGVSPPLEKVSIRLPEPTALLKGQLPDMSTPWTFNFPQGPRASIRAGIPEVFSRQAWQLVRR